MSVTIAGKGAIDIKDNVGDSWHTCAYGGVEDIAPRIFSLLGNPFYILTGFKPKTYDDTREQKSYSFFDGEKLVEMRNGEEFDDYYLIHSKEHHRIASEIEGILKRGYTDNQIEPRIKGTRLTLLRRLETLTMLIEQSGIDKPGSADTRKNGLEYHGDTELL